jgi:L-fuconate dehydratase
MSCRSTATRVGGVNENLTILLLAAKFGVLCARMQVAWASARWCVTWRCSTIVAVSGSLEGRMIEYVDHLHEHFLDPVRLHNGRLPPRPTPRGSARRCWQALSPINEYPHGRVWATS